MREEEAALHVKEAEEALAEATRKLHLAEERSAMAEAAKIELSLKLATALSELESTEDVSAMPLRYSPFPCNFFAVAWHFAFINVLVWYMNGC